MLNVWQYLTADTDDFIALWLFREYNVDLKIRQRRVQHEKPIEGVVQPEINRYVFFMSPQFPGNEHRPQFERAGVEVWLVDV